MPKPRVEDHIIERSEDIAALGLAAKELIDQVILICLLDCGMRVSELAHMQRSWWSGKVIKIPSSRKCGCFDCNKHGRPAEKIGIWTPKTKRAIRTIPVRPTFRPILDKFFYLNVEFPLGRGMIWLRVKRLAEVAGIKGNVFPHALRGTWFTRVLGEGMPEAAVRDLGGHESLATTGRYTRFSAELLEKILKEKVW